MKRLLRFRRSIAPSTLALLLLTACLPGTSPRGPAPLNDGPPSLRSGLAPVIFTQGGRKLITYGNLEESLDILVTATLGQDTDGCLHLHREMAPDLLAAFPAGTSFDGTTVSISDADRVNVGQKFTFTGRPSPIDVVSGITSCTTYDEVWLVIPASGN